VFDLDYNLVTLTPAERELLERLPVDLTVETAGGGGGDDGDDEWGDDAWAAVGGGGGGAAAAAGSGGGDGGGGAAAATLQEVIAGMRAPPTREEILRLWRLQFIFLRP
jgi:hypothetical protein